ncbi:MAG: hypothetical protein M3004_10065 [Bacteroidota bacterium]|nr:hypothetical protein [Bacteroidota bacterium]
MLHISPDLLYHSHIIDKKFENSISSISTLFQLVFPGNLLPLFCKNITRLFSDSKRTRNEFSCCDEPGRN